jgi:pleiotropic regulator 1
VTAGEDKMVKCWDLEYNKVVRHYHGHLSGVFTLSLHPILDLLISGGRDSVARVWDMRTKNQVHVLGGHVSTVSSILTAGVDPQVPFFPFLFSATPLPFYLEQPDDALMR